MIYRLDGTMQREYSSYGYGWFDTAGSAPWKAPQEAEFQGQTLAGSCPLGVLCAQKNLAEWH